MMAVTLIRRTLAVLLAALVVVALTGAPARAGTALTTPGTPVAGTVTTTGVTFSWTPSAGPVADYTIEVTAIYGTVAEHLITTTATGYTHTGLNPDSLYEYRVWANPVPGSGYAMSSPSGYLIVRTSPVPDDVPPTAPGGVYTSAVGSVSATVVVMYPSTDNRRVAGYVVQRGSGGEWADVATNDITTLYLRDLTPATTYTVAVVAVDANGNRSPRSAPVTFTTVAAQPEPTCRVQITTWGQFLSARLTIQNFTVATVLSDWRLTFTLPAAYLLGSASGIVLTRAGDQVTGTPAAWNARIGPGGGTSATISLTRTGDAPPLSGFTVTGAGVGPLACTS